MSAPIFLPKASTPRSIRSRLISAVTVLAVLPLVAIGSMLGVLQFKKDFDRDRAFALEVSRRVAAEIGGFLSTQIGGLEAVAFMFGGDDDPLWQKAVLEGLRSKDNAFEELALINPDGREKLRIHYVDIVADQDLNDKSNSGFFQALEAGESQYFGEVIFDHQRREPLMSVAMRLGLEQRKSFDGVLYGQLRLRKIWDLLTRLPLAESESIFVTDETGRVIAHNISSIVLRGARIDLNEEDGLTNRLGGDQLVFRARTPLALGNHKFWVISERSLLMALLPAVYTSLGLLFLVGMGLGVLWVVFFFAERQIIRPIQEMSGTAKSIYSGHLDKRVLVRSPDEIGLLGESFNLMTDRLRNLISSLRKEVDERRAAENALRENESVLRGIIDHSDNPISLRDSNGRHFVVNRAFSLQFGSDDVSVLNYRARDLFSSDIADARERLDAKVWRTGRPAEMEEYIFTGDQEKVFLTQAFPVLDANGAPYAVGGISVDITERKNAEREIMQLNRELEQRVQERTLKLEQANRELSATNKELEAFAYSISHDLRGPLRAIDGFSQMILDEEGAKLTSESRRGFERIRNASSKMASLIDDILKLSRSTRGEVMREVVNLSAIAEEISEELRDREPGRDIIFDIEPGLFCEGDKRFLRTILDNLLGNAWKYTAHQDQAVIEFKRAELYQRQTFFVRDNGAGFNMDYADKLFVAFERLHTQQEFEGSGIGLATVHRLMMRMGGDVWGEGAPGEGATFYFSFN